MSRREEILAVFSQVSENPLQYAVEWKEKSGRPVVGVLPMNFPSEMVHAAGALPMVLQNDEEPITVGQSRIFNFYCGYNRSLVNQTLSDKFNFLDAIMLGDHCVQLLGSADTMRNHMPDVPVLYDQLVSTINSPWAFSESRRVLNFLKVQLQDALGVEITDAAMMNSIKLFNKNRQLLRQLYDMRQNGKLHMASSDVQSIVKACMIMDAEEFTPLLEELMAECVSGEAGKRGNIPLYLSGHMCHPPKPEILSLIESCGGMVVADDLYTGYRFFSTDASTEGDALDSLTQWYLDRNKNVPCPTRSARDYDWDQYLADSVKASGAQGVIILMVKFCEPHMYFYPDIKDKFDEEGIPYLLLETEHEEMPIEALKTRLETFMEISERNALV